MKKDRRNLYFFALALLCLLVLFYAPFLGGQQSFYISDLTYYFEPLSRFIGSGLRAGHWALWNPLSFCGMPQIAIPSPGIFYPFTWLNAIFNFNQSLAISMVVHQWLAGLGSYLLIASWGWGAFPAAVFGLSMAFCGYMFSLQSNYTLIDSVAWIPLCLWSVKACNDSKGGLRARALFVTALSTGMMIAAGRPEVFLPGLLLVLAYATINALSTYLLDCRLKQTLVAYIFIVAAIACGVLLSMPTILPPLEWSALSTRAHGLANSEIFLWSSNWYDFLGILLPQPLGDLCELGSKFLSLAAARSNYIPFVPSAFLGPIVFTFALWGLGDRTFRGRFWILSVMAASLVMTLGDYTPVAPWLSCHFHFLGIFRYPEKLLIFFLGAIGILAARGAYLSVSRSPGMLSRMFTFGIWICLLFISLTLALSGQLGPMVAAFKNCLQSSADLTTFTRALILIGQSGLRATVIGLCLCAAAECLWRRRISRSAFYALVLSALAATLLAGAWLSSRHGVEPLFFSHPSYMESALKKLRAEHKSQPGFRVLSLFFDPVTYPENWPGISGEAKSPSFYQYGRQLLLPNTHLDAGLAASYGYESAETSDYRKLFWGLYKLSHASESRGQSPQVVSDLPLYRFCQMTSTAYAYSQVYKGKTQRQDLTPLNPKFFDLALENRDFNVRIYRVRDSLPRVYFPVSWSYVDSNLKAIDTIIDTDKTNFDPRERVYLLKSDKDIAELPGQNTDNGKVHSFEISGRDPEHFVISTTLDAPGLMVLADQFYPGWQASLDQHPVKIWPVDGVLRGVFVPSGSHKVQFDYKPQSLAVSLTLAGCGLVLLLLMLVVSSITGSGSSGARRQASRRLSRGLAL